jgi:cyclopropane fatty-acyl-phospholipid synthase-like methyltransferase
MNKWNVFAKQNPYWYIDTNFNGDQKKFWQNGQEQADFIFETVGRYLQQTHTVSEIGCGLGRVLIPLSHRFSKAQGIDISDEMLKLLNSQSSKFNTSNITSFLPQMDWGQSRSDLVFSILTFQHINKWSKITNYINQTSKNLNYKGIAYFQFDTRPQTIFYKTKRKLPTFLKRKTWKNDIARIRRNRKNLVNQFKLNKLRIINELNPNTANNIFILQKR